MAIPSNKIVYIARDIERAAGMTPNPTFHIVTNKSEYASELCKQYPQFVFLIESFDGRPMSTSALMEHPETTQLVPRGTRVMVFKNNSRIESIAAEKGWHLLNPSAAVAETVENKMSQIAWLGELAGKYLPPHSILLAKDIIWSDQPFIMQWGHGHTGDGTLLIQSEKELAAVQKKFPERLARKTLFVRGPSFTVNAVVAADKILIGNMSYQITGMEPFTENMFSTVGNDWALTHSLLDTDELEYIETMVGEIGNKLRESGWKGLFGVDVIRDDERDTIYLIEINARQPASTSFESFLQTENRLEGLKGLTTFEAHINALLGDPIIEQLILINDGAQIVQRVTQNSTSAEESVIRSLESAGYHVLVYHNTDINEDLIRIQSARGIMETHSKYNDRGKEIAQTLKKR